MEAIRAQKESLAILVRPVTIYPQLLINVKVASRKVAQQATGDPAVQAAVKLLADNGRAFVRLSGTEPYKA